MGIFDLLKPEPNNPSINLADYEFLSDEHTRIQNGREQNAKGVWRGIRIKSRDQRTFYVTMYNIDGNHPVWGDNVQMAEKQMKFIKETTDRIVLRGFGTDAMGASFADYGLTLHKLQGLVKRISLHMHDRDIEIIYEKAENKTKIGALENHDFDYFKNFTHKWNTIMPIEKKMQIAIQTDTLNNKGAQLFNEGDLHGAINYFEKALCIMPNNDDVLKNLKLCYSKLGDYSRAEEMSKRLNYLS